MSSQSEQMRSMVAGFKLAGNEHSSPDQIDYVT